MKHHSELLNYLAGKIKARRYLEIGVQNPKNNFDKINVPIKIGVDPLPVCDRAGLKNTTSDQFFSNNTENFDLVFIDGLHHADQVKRDFDNSLKFLNEGGFILIHDTLPDNEQSSLVPRETRVWYGDVYKFAMTLPQYSGIDFCTLDMDCGCTIVWRSNRDSEPTYYDEITWELYEKYKNGFLNIVDLHEFHLLIDGVTL